MGDKGGLPIFFCFLAYQLIIYIVAMHHSSGKMELELTILSCSTIAFMLYLQIEYGEFSSNKIAKVIAAILIIVAGASSIVHAIFVLIKSESSNESTKLYYITNFSVIATFCIISGVFQLTKL